LRIDILLKNRKIIWPFAAEKIAAEGLLGMELNNICLIEI